MSELSIINGKLYGICSDCNSEDIFPQRSPTIQAELKKFFDQQDLGLDTTFKCARCRECKECMKGAGHERMSIIQEEHQQKIRESVYIDKELGRGVAKLPFIKNPNGLLVDNTRIATRRLDSVCKKYAADKEVVEMINKGFQKLLDNGHIVLLKDLPKDVEERIRTAQPSYTIPYDIAFKEGSLSTPARPVFDASCKTPGGYSLNDLLPKGLPDMVKLLDMVLDWKMGVSALTGDIRQFYNNIKLEEDYWQFQKILLRNDLDPKAKTVLAVVTSLIYGVKPVGKQCEELIKMLADQIKKEEPEVAKLLVERRYVDDFGKSTNSREETKKLINDTTKVLQKIKMEVKGWTVSGEEPLDNLSEDGLSVGFAGMTWLPKPDFFKLNIQSLHFAKKKRGKFPPNLVKFDEKHAKTGISVEEFTPEKITRTNCTSVTARIFDITGLLAPLLLKLKSDLRKLIKFEPSWTAPIPDHQRAIWVKNFKTIEEVRDIMYVRCSIPTDAVSSRARILLLGDAADDGIIFGAYVGFQRKNGDWSCDLLFGKGLLAPENWTIPQKELHGLSSLANLKIILENAIGSWVDNYYVFTDSQIAICWSIYEKVKLSTFTRNRVVNIRSKLDINTLHHVEGKSNCTDVGTRPEQITADSVRPGSVWLTGASWMKLSIEKAKDLGVIRSAKDIKLSYDEKKIFKKELVHDEFEYEENTFATMKINKIDVQKLKVVSVFSNFIFDPLKRSFKSLVRITALVMVACRKFKKLLLNKQIERGEKCVDDLKEVDFPEPKFTIFSIKTAAMTQQNPNQTKQLLPAFFVKPLDIPVVVKQWKLAERNKVYESCEEHYGRIKNPASRHMWDQTNNWSSEDWKNNKAKLIKLSDDQLSAALDYLFKKATVEVEEFNKKETIEKLAVKEDGILYCKSRLLEATEIKAVGHIADSINIESLTGVNFKVPLVDQNSPLAVSIALHLHYEKYPHRGAETLHRLSLQHCKILKGRKIFTEIARNCIYCKKLRKKLLDQMMGPLSQSQTTISPVFYFTLVDLWGPLKSFVPGYEKVTRSTVDKPHQVYMMVFACCATGTVNCQIIEGRKTGHCLDGFNRFFCESAVPKFVYTDEEGGLMRSLEQGEIDLQDLSGVLSRQRGIEFQPVVPQGHSAHGRIERKIQMLQKSLEQSEMRNSRCTATGWQTIAKLIEHSVNSIPIGFLNHQSGGQNPKLRILTPNSLKLITTSDRAPAGLFEIPHGPADIMDNIKLKYETWYRVWSDEYLPLIMDRQKWHFSQENLKPEDVVYFKLTESKMSADWRFGKVEEVKVGQDGLVREVNISYKDTEGDDPNDWMFRSVNRPVRNIVKLFNIEDTCLMDDINEVHKLCEDLLKKNKISYSEDDPVPVNLKEKVEDENNLDKKKPKLEDVTTQPKIKPPPDNKKTKKKRKSELENLEIQMKGWSVARSNWVAQTSPNVKLMTAPSPALFLMIAGCTDVATMVQQEEMMNEHSLEKNRVEVTDVGLEDDSMFNDFCKEYEENNMYLM